MAGPVTTIVRHKGGFLICAAMATLLSLVAACGGDVPVVDMDRVTPGSKAHDAEDQGQTLRVAVGAMISPEATRHFYEDLFDRIAEKVERRAVFSQRRTYAEVNEMVRNREVDVAYVCSGPYTTGHDEFGMEILAVPVAHGQKTYNCYILAHQDGSYTSLDDMRGATFAFTDPQSNTGCLVPTYMLAMRGESPEAFFSKTFFTHSHDNSIRAVAEKQADGAAVDSLIWDFMNSLDPRYTSLTKIVEKSPPYGIPPVVVHPHLDADLKRRLKRVFLSIHQDPKAAPLLRQLQIDRFEEGDDAMYGTVREMRQWVDSKTEEEGS